MSYDNPNSLFRMGIDVLKTTVSAKTKVVLAQLGTVANGLFATENARWFQHVGFVSRPPEAVAGKEATKAVVIQNDGQDVVVASQDLRGLELAGALGPGETAVYASGADGTGQGRMVIKGDGSVSLYTTEGNASGGTGMGIFVSASDGSISLVSPAGHAIILNADGITLTAGGSSLTLGADGAVSLVGTGQTQVDGTTVVLGAVAVPGVNNALAGPTGVAGVASAKVLIQTV